MSRGQSNCPEWMRNHWMEKAWSFYWRVFQCSKGNHNMGSAGADSACFHCNHWERYGAK